jgi:hypothetical protein
VYTFFSHTKLVAPPFNYVEKGDENDAATVFPAPSPQHFFASSNFLAKISRYFAKFSIFRDAKLREINTKISQNFIDHPTPD